MIGIFGISFSSNGLTTDNAEKLSTKMHAGLNHDVFQVKKEIAHNFSMGIIIRNNGPNRDLAIKKIDEQSVIAFCGYGKFRKDKHLRWAKDMIDQVGGKLRSGEIDWESELEGSFVCVIYADGQLTIISDRFASKEMYYYEDSCSIVFGSSVDIVLASGVVPRRKNIDAAVQLLSSHFFIGNDTLVEDVFSFPSATIFKRNFMKDGIGKFVRYWDIPRCENESREITLELVDEFAEKMQQAVFELLELETGIFLGLSGGLDSRTIACFLSAETKVKAVTYGPEIPLAKKVGKVLGADVAGFKIEHFEHWRFQNLLREEIKKSRCHSVLNQYFYTPLFNLFAKEHMGLKALFDGIYMDILFSAPYVYSKFDYGQFVKTYCGDTIVLERYSEVNSQDVKRIRDKTYEKVAAENINDGPRDSESCYLKGRLMRYVSASAKSRENYFYVFKPGFNYDLVDFAHKLNFSVRKGQLYTRMLKMKFPNVMSVNYKDSYGNRKKSTMEKCYGCYTNIRHRLSSVTYGQLNYLQNGPDIFFFRQGGIDTFKDKFFESNFIEELFTDSQLRNLFNRTKKKHYMFNMFQQVLFLQSFYEMNSFSAKS